MKKQNPLLLNGNHLICSVRSFNSIRSLVWANARRGLGSDSLFVLLHIQSNVKKVLRVWPVMVNRDLRNVNNSITVIITLINVTHTHNKLCSLGRISSSAMPLGTKWNVSSWNFYLRVFFFNAVKWNFEAPRSSPPLGNGGSEKLKVAST